MEQIVAKLREHELLGLWEHATPSRVRGDLDADLLGPALRGATRRKVVVVAGGCGTGRFPGAELVGVDAAIEMVKQAEAYFPPGVAIRFQQVTAEELPLQTAGFDLVFSTLTFHHWHDQRKGIAEVARVLAPGGRWLLADFVPVGMMRYVSSLLRLKRFQDRGRRRVRGEFKLTHF